MGACISISALPTGALCRECEDFPVIMPPIQSQDLRPCPDHFLGVSCYTTPAHGVEWSLRGTTVTHGAPDVVPDS